MIKVGKRQKLIVNNISKIGAHLYAGTEDYKDNILLPNNQIEGKEIKVGDEVEVLVYKDSEDRLIATFKTSDVLAGSLAKLEVVDINPAYGAFLDWGLEKDIMLPNSQQNSPVEIGKKYLVGIYEDSKGRLSATMKIYNFLLPCKDYKKNDTVSGTVYNINPDIGIFVAVDNRYFGMIPKNECFKSFNIGDEISARVIRVREDGKLDLSPQAILSEQKDKDAEVILEKMKLLGENFRFNDDSSP
ncbi:MAG: CvfB family protein, partial [Fusobacteriaceae bacterium]